MAELSFIEGTPDHISVEDLQKGAEEIRDILDARAEDGDESGYDADDEENAREDLKSLQKILSEAGYSDCETPDEVADAFRSIDNNEGPTFTERDSLEERARDLYEEENKWPSIIASNINWDGVVEDMIEGVMEITVNNGTYYLI